MHNSFDLYLIQLERCCEKALLHLQTVMKVKFSSVRCVVANKDCSLWYISLHFFFSAIDIFPPKIKVVSATFLSHWRVQIPSARTLSLLPALKWNSLVLEASLLLEKTPMGRARKTTEGPLLRQTQLPEVLLKNVKPPACCSPLRQDVFEVHQLHGSGNLH